MELIIKETPAELALAAADWIATYAAEVLTRQDRFTIALSGGSTPERLHELLAKAPHRDRIDWARWHVFWGDERFVPFDDDKNNARMAYDTLLDHVPVPPGQIHLMRTDIAPDQAMTDYADTLHRYFDGRDTTFDLVLLGLGDDGHTLSLFPGTAVVHETDAWTASYFLEQQAMYRLTLTAPVVNRAAAVAFLVAGEKKAEPLRHVLHGPYQPDTYPAQVIRPTGGRLLWFVDEQAAGELPNG